MKRTEFEHGWGEADGEFPGEAGAGDALFGGFADAVVEGRGAEVVEAGGHGDEDVSPREGWDVELRADGFEFRAG